jgi:anti-anti-sigma factor
MATLSIATRTEGDAYVCALEGAIDSLTAAKLEGEAKGAFLSGAKRLIFDLSKVDYVASAGLRVFLMAMKSFPGKVVFAGLQPYVRETFRINALDKLATVCPTLAEALRA